MTDRLSKRELALEIWLHELGQPYRWGGDDPIAGFDCSGYVIEGLKGVGLLPREGDWTANGLAIEFAAERIESDDVQAGCLLFYARGARIGHVEIVRAVIEGQVFSIGASGGGSATRTREDAIEQNAYVKIRPARPWKFAADPFLRKY